MSDEKPGWRAAASSHWVKADDPDGAVAAMAWYTDEPHARLYYSSGGEISEMALDGTTSTVGSLRSGRS